MTSGTLNDAHIGTCKKNAQKWGGRELESQTFRPTEKAPKLGGVPGGHPLGEPGPRNPLKKSWADDESALGGSTPEGPRGGGVGG